MVGMCFAVLFVTTSEGMLPGWKGDGMGTRVQASGRKSCNTKQQYWT